MRGASQLHVPTKQRATRRLTPNQRTATALHRRRAPAPTKARRTTQQRVRWRQRNNPCSKAYDRALDGGADRHATASASAGCEGKTDLRSCFPTVASRVIIVSLLGLHCQHRFFSSFRRGRER